MPSVEAMKDMTRIVTQLIELEEIGISGVIPNDVNLTELGPGRAPRLVPYILGGLLDLTKQLALHTKQLQLEVQQLHAQLRDCR